MTSSNLQTWQVIRQDENGSRYRIGHCATRAEAQRLIRRLQLSADALTAQPSTAQPSAHYLVERADRTHR